MIHKMRLVDFAFNEIKSGIKDIEVRLNDPKRQLIKIGDIIEFSHIDTGELLRVKVINLYKYKTFKELFDKFECKRLGLNENDNYEIINQFYTKEEQEKYGVLGIEVKLI